MVQGVGLDGWMDGWEGEKYGSGGFDSGCIRYLRLLEGQGTNEDCLDGSF
jgi:hypothetical protein